MSQIDLLDQIFVPDGDLAESGLGDETVMLHLSSGLYFGLDAISTEYWERLKAGVAIRELCAEMAARYEMPLEQVESDARTFLSELIENRAARLA